MPSSISGGIRRPGLSTILTIAAILIGVGIPIFLADTLHQQYVQALASAENRAANTARALEQHAARTFETTDTYLRAVVSLVGPRAADEAPEAIHASLRDRLTRSRHLHNFLIFGRDGKALVEGAAYPARALDVSDRDYFQVQRNQSGTGLFVGSPVVGRLTGKLTLPISLRMEDPDGSFAGIVVATLDPDAFQTVYDAIDNGPDATLNLWRSDGTLLVRSPHKPELIGRSYAASKNYRQHVPAKDKSPFWSKSATDGVKRVIAFGYLDGYPLYVSASLGRDDALAGWRRSAIIQAATAGGLALVLVLSLLSLAREVRRRQVSDLQIRASEEQYRLLAENTSDLIVFKPTMTGRRGYVSPAVRAILGWEPAEYAALPSSAIIHPDEMADVVRAYGSLSPERQQVTHVHRLRHKAGHYVWIESVFRLVGSGTQDRTVVVSGRDITERLERDRALRESEARYRTLAENTSDVITRLDLAFKRTYVSPSCLRLFGFTAEEMAGAQPSASIHPDDALAVREVAHRLAAGDIVGDQTAITYRARHARGHWIWIEATLHLVREDGGSADSIVCVLRDAGARKADEAALLVAREQADAARAQAERASLAKGEFLATMSHEIRTPLNGILGYSDLLLDEPNLAPAARRHAERIGNAGAALLTVVNDILDFSKIEVGQIALEAEPFALEGLLDNAISIVRAAADQKGLSLSVGVNSALPRCVVGDQDRLRQVLLNLLNNAIKFTRAGEVALTIHPLPGEQDRAVLRFAVQDTGIGIPAAKQHLLFERFSQIDGTVQREFGGTGLGLAISKRLVELMGGVIGVASEEGRGSTFWFEISLPLAVQELPVPAHSAPQPIGDPRRLLLVEDVRLNQELALAVLQRAGHEVDVVSSGTDAISAVQVKDYDLVLMDVQMPGMDGTTATRLIRALDHPAATVPIVAMTANVLPHQVETFRTAGMQDHVGKPFKRDALLAVVERWALTLDRAEIATNAERLDKGVFDDMVERLGRTGVDRLLGALADELEQRLGTDGTVPDRERLARDAHAMVSAGSTLGFTELADLCREIETACDAGEECEALVQRLHHLRRSTIRQIKALRAA